MKESKNKNLNYQKVIFNSIICTNKDCRKKRVFINKENEKENIVEINNGLYGYKCECGNHIIFKY